MQWTLSHLTVEESSHFFAFPRVLTVHLHLKMRQVCEDRWVLEKGCEGPVEEGEWYCKVNLPVVHLDNNTRPQPAIVQVPYLLLQQISFYVQINFGLAAKQLLWLQFWLALHFFYKNYTNKMHACFRKITIELAGA